LGTSRLCPKRSFNFIGPEEVGRFCYKFHLDCFSALQDTTQFERSPSFATDCIRVFEVEISSQAVAADRQAADARAALKSLHSSLHEHSQKALIATAHLERIAVTLCDAHGLQPQILLRVQQLKNSLSHLLVMGIDDVT
jgi:hypothetical protein